MSDDFDPKAYLAAKAAEAETPFDPKAYLAAKGVATRAEPSRAASALAGVQNLGSFGWGDELGAALQGAFMKATGKGDFGETYRQAVGENRRDAKAARDTHPYFYYGAGAPAAVAASMAMPALKAGQGAGLMLRALAGAGNGALQGAIAGAGESEAGTPMGVLKDAGLGAGLGGAAGGALPVAGAALKGVGKALVQGVVKPSAAAQELAHLGVDTSKLTLGQLNPEGVMAQMEEAGQHALGSGKAIEAQREAGVQAWRDAVLHKAMAPNAPLGPGGTAQKLAGAYESFAPAYEAAGSRPVATAGPGQQSMGDQLRKAFGAAVGDEGVLATDADRAAVARYLNNQASAVHFQPGEASSVGDLQAVRSNLRQQLAQALGGSNPNQSYAKLLGNAEEAVTRKIGENLPPQELAALRATDAKYGAYKTVEDAVRRAGDQAQGLMPQHLSAAVKAATSNGAYARGAGGALRDLAVAGSEALQAKTPPTGVRALIQALPGSHYLTSPAAALANTGPMKQALLGQTRGQLAAQALLEALSESRAGAAAQKMTAAARPGSGSRLLSKLLPLPANERGQLAAQALRGDTP